MIDTIVILKLTNDKEIIGKYSTEDDFAIFVKNPLEVSSVYDVNSGISKCVLVNYMSFSNQSDIGLGFPKLHILHCLPVKPVIEKYYYNSLKYMADNKVDDFNDSNDFEEFPSDSQYIHKNLSKCIH